jgi:tetratricopeptide (TPR) repeat protein
MHTFLLKEWDKALADVEAALVLQPDLTRTVELDPENANFRSRRSEAYRQLGRFEEALQDVQQACAIDDSDGFHNSWSLSACVNWKDGTK